MSQGQLQREGCPHTIVSEGIEIGKERILARLVNNNLYIPDLADSGFPPNGIGGYKSRYLTTLAFNTRTSWKAECSSTDKNVKRH